MLLMIDNYDSFTYNLVQYFGELDTEVRIVRNDALDVAALLAMKPQSVCISPGPSEPKNAGVSLEVIRAFAGLVPVLGVCLGHQAIGEVFGGRTVRAPKPMHGKTDTIECDGLGVFSGLPKNFAVARYHSLVIDPETLPDDLIVTARAGDGTIQGVRHRTLAVEGVQFHPESIATEHGHAILANFLKTSVS